jgi:hypothetical protein
MDTSYDFESYVTTFLRELADSGLANRVVEASHMMSAVAEEGECSC